MNEQEQPLDLLHSHFGSDLSRLIGTEEPFVEKLAGDGSSRCFYRFHGPDNSCIAVFPEPGNPLSIRESESYVRIGRHLASKGVPVPTIHNYDKITGAIVMEDLGDVHLQFLIRGCDHDYEIHRWYSRILEILINMQLKGMEGFETSCCFDTPKYDRKLMIERESLYFVNAFLKNYLGLNIEENKLIPEFEKLASIASEAPATFFLHRDFQSRNILVHEGEPRIVDFQGGRLGPLGYDLASLLYDPYVNLAEDLRRALLDEYVQALSSRLPVDKESFKRHFWHLVLQRALQVLGAFGFLTRVKEKPFFEAYIPIALRNLRSVLEYEILSGFDNLRGILKDLDFRPPTKGEWI
ncbi:MAG: phosphotransferase [Pseudomonadota bacterium]